MAGDPFSPVGQNDPFVPNAAFHNETLRAILHMRRGQDQTRRPSFQQEPNGIKVFVRNLSALDCDVGNVLVIRDSEIKPDTNEDQFKLEVALHGDLADSPLDLGRFLVCAEPIAAKGEEEGAVYHEGWCWASGAIYALVDIKDVNHTHADIDLAVPSITLSSGLAGAARILYPNTFEATGVQGCQLLYPTPNPYPLLFKTTSAQADGQITACPVNLDGSTAEPEMTFDVPGS